MRVLLVILVASLLAVPALASEKKTKVEPHEDAVVKKAKETFEERYKDKRHGQAPAHPRLVRSAIGTRPS